MGLLASMERQNEKEKKPVCYFLNCVTRSDLPLFFSTFGKYISHHETVINFPISLTAQYNIQSKLESRKNEIKKKGNHPGSRYWNFFIIVLYILLFSSFFLLLKRSYSLRFWAEFVKLNCIHSYNSLQSSVVGTLDYLLALIIFTKIL